MKLSWKRQIEMFDYDVIVIGCGPAGLMAVAELKEKGINVLGIDKKPMLDRNVRSASGFFIDGQEMNGEYIQCEPLKGKTRITYTKCGFSLEYSSPMEGIHHTHIISNTGSHFQATSRKKTILPSI
jgi:thioredoxin reductase